MADSGYDAQEQKLQKEIADRKKKIKEIKAKRAAANRKHQNNIKAQLGGVIRKYVGRPLEDEDVRNLDRFLYGQEHRGQGRFFTDFMNNEKYRNTALTKPEYKDMPDNQTDSSQKKKKEGSDTPEAQKSDTGDPKPK